MDATLRITLEKILNLHFDDQSWNQATLPVKYGGIGVRKMSSVALPAFLSSVHSIKELSSRILNSNSVCITYATEALESWKVRCPNVDISKERTTQKLWDAPLVQLTHENLVQNLTSAVDRARLLALSEKESGYWLHALPSKNLGTLLDNESFRVALGLRLGTPLCLQHKCPCGKENAGQSHVLSAFSVLTPLAQLALASVDESHNQLCETIGLPDDETIKEAFPLVNSKVSRLKGITLNMASKIYVADRYELNGEFAEDTRTTFGSEIESINFLESQKAADVVNSWVEEHTNNRIKDLVSPDSLTADTRGLLVNAIYFKGRWKNQFKKSLTYDADFYVNADDTKKVHMMSRTGDYKYAESLELGQVIQIPYEGDETSMVFVLPRNIQHFNEVQETLKDPSVFEKTMETLYSAEVEVKLPRFKIETTTDLKEVLIKMGLWQPFDPSYAKLTKLIKDLDSGLYIDSAKQKAFIEVNEEGAEAAAANVFNFAYATSLISEPRVIRFTADHPFFFYLRGGKYTLFNGAYYAS
ncbi:antichymotrypsin-2 [Bicyclus anynana]|uniref:Antichymotrypsin-2 n=1 Tax=Bicyclus anynana TaxID=110368 RepID=A0ABM3LHU8_BICAN|nr:antichymotrypsin-2 [Bicyclus anynana]